jgi:hypothetical protein
MTAYLLYAQYSLKKSSFRTYNKLYSLSRDRNITSHVTFIPSIGNHINVYIIPIKHSFSRIKNYIKKF